MFILQRLRRHSPTPVQAFANARRVMPLIGAFYCQSVSLAHRSLYLSDHYEFYLWIKDEDAQQVDPIFVLGNAKEGHDFARSLHWEYEDAYYNRYPEE